VVGRREEEENGRHGDRRKRETGRNYYPFNVPVWTPMGYGGDPPRYLRHGIFLGCPHHSPSPPPPTTVLPRNEPQNYRLGEFALNYGGRSLYTHATEELPLGTPPSSTSGVCYSNANSSSQPERYTSHVPPSPPRRQKNLTLRLNCLPRPESD